MTPAGLRVVINNAVAIYFLEATLAAAFVTRWCTGSNFEITEGAFQMREDRPVRRNVAGPHKTLRGAARAHRRLRPSRLEYRADLFR